MLIFLTVLKILPPGGVHEDFWWIKREKLASNQPAEGLGAAEQTENTAEKGGGRAGPGGFWPAMSTRHWEKTNGGSLELAAGGPQSRLRQQLRS